MSYVDIYIYIYVHVNVSAYIYTPHAPDFTNLTCLEKKCPKVWRNTSTQTSVPLQVVPILMGFPPMASIWFRKALWDSELHRSKKYAAVSTKVRFSGPGCILLFRSMRNTRFLHLGSSQDSSIGLTMPKLAIFHKNNALELFTRMSRRVLSWYMSLHRGASWYLPFPVTSSHASTSMLPSRLIPLAAVPCRISTESCVSLVLNGRNSTRAPWTRACHSFSSNKIPRGACALTSWLLSHGSEFSGTSSSSVCRVSFAFLVSGLSSADSWLWKALDLLRETGVKAVAEHSVPKDILDAFRERNASCRDSTPQNTHIYIYIYIYNIYIYIYDI